MQLKKGDVANLLNKINLLMVSIGPSNKKNLQNVKTYLLSRITELSSQGDQENPDALVQMKILLDLLKNKWGIKSELYAEIFTTKLDNNLTLSEFIDFQINFITDDATKKQFERAKKLFARYKPF